MSDEPRFYSLNIRIHIAADGQVGVGIMQGSQRHSQEFPDITTALVYVDQHIQSAVQHFIEEVKQSERASQAQ